MIIKPVHTRIFLENEDLIQFIREHITKIQENSILAVTSKIVALSEGRTANREDKTRLIQKESQWAKKTKYAWLTIKDNMVMMSAGIDESNAHGRLILLPSDSHRSAKNLQAELKKIYKIKRLGVLITDSRVMPFRAGAVGFAVGYFGFRGIRDYRGKPDIFGRKMKISRANVADSLATSAVINMGEGDEQKPLAIITDAPVEFNEKNNASEMLINIKNDVYSPLFERIRKI